MLQQAVTLHKKGRLAEAASLYRAILAQNPRQADALHLLGLIEYQGGKPAAALDLLDRAVEIRPTDAVFLSNRSIALRDLKRFDEALASCDRALAGKPGFADALNNRGTILLELKRFDDALASCDGALRAEPRHVEALINRGSALQGLRRYDDALAACGGALALAPDRVDVLNNRGNLFQELKRFPEALADYDRALAIHANYPQALIGRGNALLELKRYDDALACYDRVLAIDPQADYLPGLRCYCKMMLCRWHGLAEDFSRLADGIRAGRKTSVPFPVLGTPLSAALQRQCSQIYVADRCPENALPLPENQPSRGKLRLGYFSTDFRNHAVASLTAEMFERHDRSRFEVIAFSLGPPAQDAMSARLRTAFDRFIEAGAMPDKAVALLARQLEIDIAIDLTGFTQNNRASIFAMRAAPLQVNYLGYPGTMGAAYIDYIVADSTVIPPDERPHYAEKIVTLPDSYMVQDSKRPVPERRFSRTACGLPEDGFVFCCFNHSYKIGAEIFDLWMRLLQRVEGSVLWLPQSNDTAMRNLTAAAAACGLDPARLLFAPPLARSDDHLARLASADLFLDTLPYNAHTTAADALWAGVPVLTCLGKTFAGRVAASLLNALGLPELIVEDLAAYETLALEIATEPQRLAALRQRLATNRRLTPLFDTVRFTRHMEAAYLSMWQRRQAGLAPDHIAVVAEAAA